MARKKTVKVDIEAPQQKGAIEKLGLSMADQDRLSSQVQRDFGNAEQTKYLWIPDRNEDVQNYFGIAKGADWPFKGASKIKSQFYRIVVDTLSGNLIKSLFLAEKPIKVSPSPLTAGTTDTALQNMKYVEDLHNSLQANEYRLRSVLDRGIPTSLIESFVVFHPVYEYLTTQQCFSVKRLVPKEAKASSLVYDVDTDSVSTPEGEFVPSFDVSRGYEDEDMDLDAMQEVTFEVEKEDCVKDGISIKTINGYRFYMPIGTPGETPYEKVQRAPYTIHQLFYTLREVEEMSEQGFFENVDIVRYNMVKADEAKRKGEKPVIAASVYDRQRELITYTKLQQAGFLLDTARLEYEYVEVLKWCGSWKINGKRRDVIVWLAKDSNTILRVEPNIFGEKPYFPLVPFPVDETPYGESLCKIVRPLVKEIDLLMRTVTNIALMKAAPPKFYDPASGFNPQAVGQYGPNSWIPAREPSRNVLVPPSPEDPQVAFQMLQFIINIVERITGVNEVIQGQISDRANTTATEVQNALARSGVRFDTIYERVKEQIKPMFRYIHKLTIHNMPAQKEVKLMGKENEGRIVKIHKDMLQGAYEFEIGGNSVVAEQSELQNALTLFNTVGQHPYLTYKPESVYYLLFNIVKKLNPLAMDKILPTPDEVKQLERDRASVQGEQEQIASQQGDPQAEAQAQAAQMDMQAKQMQMQMEVEKQKADLQMKQAQFQQESRQKEELHQQKLRQMKEEGDAKLKIMEEQKNAQRKAAKDSKSSD